MPRTDNHLRPVMRFALVLAAISSGSPAPAKIVVMDTTAIKAADAEMQAAAGLRAEKMALYAAVGSNQIIYYPNFASFNRQDFIDHAKGTADPVLVSSFYDQAIAYGKAWQDITGKGVSRVSDQTVADFGGKFVTMNSALELMTKSGSLDIQWLVAQPGPSVDRGLELAVKTADFLGQLNSANILNECNAFRDTPSLPNASSAFDQYVARVRRLAQGAIFTPMVVADDYQTYRKAACDGAEFAKTVLMQGTAAFRPGAAALYEKALEEMDASLQQGVADSLPRARSGAVAVAVPP